MARYPYPTNRRRLPGREANVVTALRRKYAELKGADDAEALAHVGATLLLFKPGEDLAAIPAVRAYKVHRERWTASVLSILRRAAEPMTAQELARAVMRERGIPATDYRRFKSIECGIHGVLGRLEGDGIERVGEEPKRWRLSGAPKRP